MIAHLKLHFKQKIKTNISGWTNMKGFVQVAKNRDSFFMNSNDSIRKKNFCENKQ